MKIKKERPVVVNGDEAKSMFLLQVPNTISYHNYLVNILSYRHRAGLQFLLSGVNLRIPTRHPFDGTKF